MGRSLSAPSLKSEIWSPRSYGGFGLSFDTLEVWFMSFARCPSNG
jgi:hypothetical protein